MHGFAMNEGRTPSPQPSPRGATVFKEVSFGIPVGAFLCEVKRK